MRFHGQAKLGFYPLPSAEAVRLRRQLSFPEQFSALDPCVGDGAAFATLLESSNALSYGIEIDAHRSAQARAVGIDVLHANTLDVRCSTESVSLMYLNPPYDWEYGQGKNERLELIFLQHTYRWLKCEGVLLFVIPQPRIQTCARVLAEHFRDIRSYRLTAPESLRFKQVAILAVRRKRNDRLRDSALTESVRYLERLAIQDQLAELGDALEVVYQVPSSGPLQLTNTGLPLDQIEDLLLQSAAYRQATRILIREQRDVGGRPLTPLHGGHVGLLCTAGMLNGVFGKDELLHIAHWKSVKFTDHWEEEEEGGAIVVHDRERFSHELTLIFADGRTQILTHEKQSPPC
ncbi:MAG TPA: DUF6094 domain-containing protein [Candidatus Sulfotelmatobacter sp.]|nr:DUF6094 domain-containing protein [Candidatus Sulfotelmatobacter sp.]